MAPSLVRLGAAALACASGAVALEAYQLKEAYTPGNFFDKFDFFSDSDPNGGFVQYRTKTAAAALGLIKTTGDDVSISVDSISTDIHGRSSVRLESATKYNGGLFIADFSHFPKAACGAWPGFWMYSPDSPTAGEIDIYQGWHLNTANKIVAHTAGQNVVGACKVLSSDLANSNVISDNCQAASGCAAQETNGLFGKSTGGICEYSFPLRLAADEPLLTCCL